MFKQTRIMNPENIPGIFFCLPKMGRAKKAHSGRALGSFLTFLGAFFGASVLARRLRASSLEEEDSRAVLGATALESGKFTLSSLARSATTPLLLEKALASIPFAY
jgi:hypothetical protein